MAKLKSKRCSTGHGTGVTPPVDLRERLARSHRRAFRRRFNLGQLGSVERPQRTRRRQGQTTVPGRIGYFRRWTERAAAVIAENRANLLAWPA